MKKCSVCRTPLARDAQTNVCAGCAARYDRIYGSGKGATPDAASTQSTQQNEPRESETMKTISNVHANKAHNEKVPARRDREPTKAEPAKAAAKAAHEDREQVMPNPKAAKAEGAKKESWDHKMRKLPHVRRAETKIRNLAKRVGRVVSMVSAWEQPKLAEVAKGAAHQLAELEAALRAMPDDFLPPRAAVAKTGTTSKTGLANGALVAIREKVAAKYDDIIEEADRVGMVVLASKKGRVVCRTKTGEKVILPRGHVVAEVEKPATTVAQPAHQEEAVAAAV